MKKKILGGIAVLAIAAVAAWNVNLHSSNTKLSDIMLANVEALASAENPDCPNGCVDGGGGCYCYIWYDCYTEYNKW